ncbi:MAG: enoyl-ACP reductase [Chloroflexota bacterium]
MGVLEGKRAVIFGVANKRSIAWGIAQALHREGAAIALTYQNDRVEKMVRDCADQIPGTLMVKADVQEEGQIESVYARLGERWDQLDIVVHSLAFAPADELKGRFVDTSRAGFKSTLEVSAYSLIPIAKYAIPLMKEGGSVMTMTYIASERVFPSYNVMGVAKAALECSVRYLAADLGPENIRVNAISAGPISTLAARGIPKFVEFQKDSTSKAPLRRTTDQAEVGDTAVFLASPLSRAITGEVIFVDQGFHILGV